MSLSQHSSSITRENISAHPREREQMAVYRVYFFGQFRLFRDTRPIGEPTWRRNKAKSLLKWFILNNGKLCSVDQLIELFWSDIPPEAAHRNLHVTIHYLRHLLEPSLGSGQESTYIRRNNNNFYWFHQDETWWIDIQDVDYLLNTARQLDRSGDQAKAAFHYRKIVNYYDQGFLPEDTYEDWFHTFRYQYDCMGSQVLVRLIQIYLQRNELEETLEYAYQALLKDPYCEPAAKAIVHVYCQQGNTSGAIRKLDDFQGLLKNELGMEPTREFRILREEIVKSVSIRHA